jgi:hypothetical protein
MTLALPSLLRPSLWLPRRPALPSTLAAFVHQGKLHRNPHGKGIRDSATGKGAAGPDSCCCNTSPCLLNCAGNPAPTRFTFLIAGFPICVCGRWPGVSSAPYKIDSGDVDGLYDVEYNAFASGANDCYWTYEGSTDLQLSSYGGFTTCTGFSTSVPGTFSLQIQIHLNLGNLDAFAQIRHPFDGGIPRILLAGGASPWDCSSAVNLTGSCATTCIGTSGCGWGLASSATVTPIP